MIACLEARLAMNGAKFHSIKTFQAVDLSAQILEVFGES